jgi:hypothetical protein
MRSTPISNQLPSLCRRSYHSARQKAEEVPCMQRDQNLTKMAYHLHPKEKPAVLEKQATTVTNVIRTTTVVCSSGCVSGILLPFPAVEGVGLAA